MPIREKIIFVCLILTEKVIFWVFLFRTASKVLEWLSVSYLRRSPTYVSAAAREILTALWQSCWKERGYFWRRESIHEHFWTTKKGHTKMFSLGTWLQFVIGSHPRHGKLQKNWVTIVTHVRLAFVNSICGDDDLTFQLCAQKSIPFVKSSFWLWPDFASESNWTNW